MEAREQLLLAALIGSLLSVVGDVVILHGLWAMGRASWITYHRLLMAMSAADLVASLFYALGDVLMPPPAGNGNMASCRLQGFFQQVSLAVPLLNACLALNYVLVLHYRWNNERLRSTAEPIMFWAVSLVTLAFAIIPLPLDLYNDADMWCWISDRPRLCSLPDSGVPCEAGQRVGVARLALYYIPLWIAIFATVGIMIYLVAVAYKHDKRMSRIDGLQTANQGKYNNTQRMLRQASLYCVAFVLTWIFLSIMRFRQAFDIENTLRFQLTSTFFVTLQGFFNMLIFLLPRVSHAAGYPAASLGVKLLYIMSLRSQDDLHECAAKNTDEASSQQKPTSTSFEEADTSRSEDFRTADQTQSATTSHAAHHELVET